MSFPFLSHPYFLQITTTGIKYGRYSQVFYLIYNNFNFLRVLEKEKRMWLL